MKTKFILNFNKRMIISSRQRADYNSNIIIWLKRLLSKTPLSTYGTIQMDIKFAEIYLSNIYKSLKRTLKEFYEQSDLEMQICETLLHESFHSALYEVGHNNNNSEKNERNVDYIMKRL